METQIVIKQILNGLNEDLEGEYASGIQYLQHSSLLNGKANHSVINELVKNSTTEFYHAKIINDIIVYLGGVPVIGILKKETSLDYLQMIKNDLQGEYGAVTRYLNRIRQLETIGMHEFSQKIKDIISQKQKHIRSLKAILIPNKVNI